MVLIYIVIKKMQDSAAVSFRSQFFVDNCIFLKGMPNSIFYIFAHTRWILLLLQHIDILFGF